MLLEVKRGGLWMKGVMRRFERWEVKKGGEPGRGFSCLVMGGFPGMEE